MVLRTRHLGSRTGALLGSALLVAVLSLARDFFVPVAVAGLLAFFLVPLASLLERLKVQRGIAAVASVLLLAAALGGLAWAIAGQALSMTRRLPEYRENVVQKLRSLTGKGSIGEPLAEARENLESLKEDINGKEETADPATAPAPAGEADAVPVRIVEEDRGAMDAAAAIVGPLLLPLAMTLVVLVLTAFFLVYRADLRDRLIRLSSMSRIVVTTQALDEVSRRISRYLTAMSAVNTIYASLLAIAFHVVGLPDAAVWGLFAGLLRFVPYVGTTIGAAMPAIVSVAVFDDWGRTGLVVAAIVVADFLAANVVEPLVYGRRTGLSPIAVVLCTFFWTWLWGMPGLLLAVPMSLVLVVVGQHVTGLHFLRILLGEGPILDAGERAYQRLLALDPGGARRVVEERARRAPEEAYDEVLVPALVRAAEDHERGALDEAGLAAVRDGARSLLDDLPAPAVDVPPNGARVLCVPVGDALDGLAAEMLERLLRARGVNAEATSFRLLAWEAAEAVAESPPAVACLVGLPPLGASRARFLCRRIRQRAAGVRVLAAVLDASAERSDLEDPLLEAGAERVATRLAEAADLARTLALTAPSVGATVPAPSRTTA